MMFFSNLLIYLILHLQHTAFQVILIHKKESKLDCSNYLPTSLLSNLDKILQKLMSSRCISFQILVTLFILSSLAFDKHTTPPLH